MSPAERDEDSTLSPSPGVLESTPGPGGRAVLWQVDPMTSPRSKGAMRSQRSSSLGLAGPNTLLARSHTTSLLEPGGSVSRAGSTYLGRAPSNTAAPKRKMRVTYDGLSPSFAAMCPPLEGGQDWRGEGGLGRQEGTEGGRARPAALLRLFKPLVPEVISSAGSDGRKVQFASSAPCSPSKFTPRAGEDHGGNGGTLPALGQSGRASKQPSRQASAAKLLAGGEAFPRHELKRRQSAPELHALDAAKLSDNSTDYEDRAERMRNLRGARLVGIARKELQHAESVVAAIRNSDELPKPIRVLLPAPPKELEPMLTPTTRSQSIGPKFWQKLTGNKSSVMDLIGRMKLQESFSLVDAARERSARILDGKLQQGKHGREQDQAEVQPDAQEGGTTCGSGSERLMQGLARANPAAFDPDAAEIAEADYHACASRVRAQMKEAASCSDYRHNLTLLGATRPFFVSPVLQREALPRAAETARGGNVSRSVQSDQSKWNILESCFSLRAKESEARDFFDTDKVLKAQFALDWGRVVAKSKFRRLVAREDPTGGANLQQELDAVHDELFRHVRVVRGLFTYYAMSSSGASCDESFQLSQSQWLALCSDLQLVDPRSAACKLSDLATMFISVNFEEDSNTAEALANDDSALVRFELAEILVRIAHAKFIVPKLVPDFRTAVCKLFEDCIVPNLPSEAALETDNFRRDRLYTPEVDALVAHHFDLLMAGFKLFKAPGKFKFMLLEHWLSMLDTLKLMGNHTGITRREAKLVFAWSQLVVTDELRKRKRATALMFFDFVEAVARLADALSPPSEQQLRQFFNIDPDSATRPSYWEYYKAISQDVNLAGQKLPRRATRVAPATPTDSPMQSQRGLSMCGVPSRPLVENLAALVEVMMGSWKENFGGSSELDITQRVSRMGTFVSGGIERG